MAKQDYTTTIRMGAGHYDMTIEGLHEGPLSVDLSKATSKDKNEVVTHLVNLHAIPGERKRYHPPRKPTLKREVGDKRHGSNDKARQTVGPRHGAPDGLPSSETPGQAEAIPARKKHRRRRSPALPVPNPGPIA